MPNYKETKVATVRNHRQIHKKTQIKLEAAEIFSIFLALAPIVSPYSQFFGNDLGVVTSQPWLAMSAYFAVGLFIYIAIFAKKLFKNNFNLTQIDLCFIAFYLWIVLSITWAHNKFEAFEQILVWSMAMISYFIIRITIITKQKLLFFVICFIISAVIVSALGLLQNAFGFSWVVQAAPPASFFGNKNMGAHYPLIIFPFAILLALLVTNPKHRLLLSIAAAIMLSYIIISLARAAYMGMFVGMIVLLTLYYTTFRINFRQHLTKLLKVLLGIFVFALVLIIVNSSAKQSKQYLAEAGSIVEQAQKGKYGEGNVRLIKWHNAWELFKDNWFLGTGINNWVIQYPVYHQVHGNDYGVSINSQSTHTHNDFIQLAVELGIIGVLLFLVLIYLVCKQVLRWHNSKDKDFTLLNIALVSSCCAIAIDALFSFPLQLVNNIILVVAILALYNNFELTSKLVTTYQIPKLAPKNIKYSAIILAVMAAYLYNQWFNAEIYMRKSYLDVAKKDYKAAMYYAELAYKANPYRYDTLKYRAVTYKLLKRPKAAEAIEAVLDSYPYNLNSLNRAVSYYIEVKQYPKALKHAKVMQQIAPRNAYIYQNLAAIYQHLGDQKNFHNALANLLRIAPNHPQAELFKSILYGNK